MVWDSLYIFTWQHNYCHYINFTFNVLHHEAFEDPSLRLQRKSVKHMTGQYIMRLICIVV
jgi:hypothetical protein